MEEDDTENDSNRYDKEYNNEDGNYEAKGCIIVSVIFFPNTLLILCFS